MMQHISTLQTYKIEYGESYHRPKADAACSTAILSSIALECISFIDTPSENEKTKAALLLSQKAREMRSISPNGLAAQLNILIEGGAVKHSNLRLLIKIREDLKELAATIDGMRGYQNIGLADSKDPLVPYFSSMECHFGVSQNVAKLLIKSGVVAAQKLSGKLHIRRSELIRLGQLCDAKMAVAA